MHRLLLKYENLQFFGKKKKKEMSFTFGLHQEL